MKTLVFTGMMGSGKTSVGKILAEQLGIKFIDIDNEITLSQKMTINDIFEQMGESYFRKLEEDIIKQVFEPENLIIALGGGAFESESTREFLLSNSNVVYLKSTPESIYLRISQDKSRPLLKDNMNIQTISKILNPRIYNYEKAHHIVVTDNKNPEDIAQEVIKWIL